MKTLIYTASIIALTTFASCKKCAECHYDFNESEIELGEFCKDDLESIEHDGYYDSATDSTYEVHCHEH
ncbi:hypothetical protein [Crocinitomix catalasitica]|uniref:hypothetical protein n=1 Tax=Crocinitomix catalasitica TaxID=184607 RepID=UPI00048022DF|nr:hypothetical protein [Crocinitomix catalasitica]